MNDESLFLRLTNGASLTDLVGGANPFTIALISSFLCYAGRLLAVFILLVPTRLCGLPDDILHVVASFVPPCIGFYRVGAVQPAPRGITPQAAHPTARQPLLSLILTSEW